MSHLVGDDIIEGSIGLHIREVIGVEGHLPFGGEKCGGSGIRGPQDAWTCLTEDATDPIDRGPLRKDDQIVYELAVVIQNIG